MPPFALTCRILNKTAHKLVPCDLEIAHGKRAEKEGEREFRAIEPNTFAFAFKVVSSTMIPRGVKGFATYQVGVGTADMVRLDFHVPVTGDASFSCRSLNGKYHVSVPGTLTGNEVEVPFTVTEIQPLDVLTRVR